VTLADTISPKKLVNRCRLVSSYLAGKAILSGFPVEMAIETTSRCNLACTMCPRRETITKLGDMSFELLKKIIDESKDYVELVYLHGRGEPLLHPELARMIEYCKMAGVNVGISSNATLLTEDKAKSLIDAGLDFLIIGLDGATKETYEKIRRGGCFETVTENIRSFLETKAKASSSPFTEIQMVYMDDNKSEAQGFLDMWKSSGADEVRVRLYVDYPGLEKSPQGKGMSQHSDNTPRPCFLIWRTFDIRWDGTVVPCCWEWTSSSTIGNAKAESLSAIWNSPRMVRMREMHVQGRAKEIDLCRGCVLRPSRWPYILGCALLDVLTLKKLLPKAERLVIKKGFKWLSYVDGDSAPLSRL